MEIPLWNLSCFGITLSKVNMVFLALDGMWLLVRLLSLAHGGGMSLEFGKEDSWVSH